MGSLLRRLGVGCAASAIGLLAIALVAPTSHSNLALLAGAALFMAFLFFVVGSIRRREPIPMRSGETIHADSNPIAYGLGYGLMILFGVGGLLVFLILYIMS